MLRFDDEAPKQESCFEKYRKLIAGVSILLLLGLIATVIALGVLLDEEIRKNHDLQAGLLTTTPQPNTPSVCSSQACVVAAGDILAAMDLTADPCEDFYQYTCGKFVRDSHIPAGYSSYSKFSRADSRIMNDLHDLLEEDAPANEPSARHKAREYYNACLNTTQINMDGMGGMQQLVTGIGGFYLAGQPLPAEWRLERLLLDRNKYSVSGFFTFLISEDMMNVSNNVLMLTQGGLGMGARDFYDSSSMVNAYSTMMTKYAQLIEGTSQVQDTYIQEIVEFEKKLAKIFIPTADLRDPSSMYQKETVGWLDTNYDFLIWSSFFHALFGSLNTPIVVDHTEPVVLYGSKYLSNLTTLMNEYLRTTSGKRTLQNYAVMQAVMEYAPSLGDNFKEVYDEFASILYGTQGTLPRWQICVSDTDSSVGFGLGAMYIERHFSEQGKDSAEFVIESVQSAFRDRVTDLEWMDAETKTKALEKMDKLTYTAAYPEYIKDDKFLDNYYSLLDVTESYVDNQFYLYSFLFEGLFKTIHEAPDNTIWYMTPQTVNAYYSPTENKFVVPAGILSPPFFYQSQDMPPAINFAAIGTVTGHEIGHGFDDQGSQYDGDGNLKNWWSNETYTAFASRTQCLVDQYEEYEAEGLHLNGRMTLGENIGDNGGLRASYQAYKTQYPKPMDESVLVGLEQLSPDQLFFVAYAQVWCILYTPEAMQNQIMNNVHSPGNFRVIGPVSNHPDFATAFSCPANASMNRPNKCEVW